MAVEDWLGDWTFRHMAVCGRGDFPDFDTDSGRIYWEEIRRVLVRSGADQIVAEEASSNVARCNLFPGQHAAALTQEIAAIFKRRSAALGEAAPNSREAAEIASRDCVDCGGCGTTTRYRHRAIGDGRAMNAVGARIPFYCRCAMGRWVESKQREQAHDVHRRVLDLDRFPDLWLGPVAWTTDLDNAWRYRPEQWDAVLNRPLDVEPHHQADKAALARGNRRPEGSAFGPPEEKPRPALVKVEDPPELVAAADARKAQARARLDEIASVAAAAQFVIDSIADL